MPRYRISVPETRWCVYWLEAETPKEALGRLLDALNGVMEDKDLMNAILDSTEDSDYIDVHPYNKWDVKEESV